MGGAALLLPLLSACASGDYRSDPPPPKTTTTSTTTTPAAEVTHRGVVATFSPSARLVTLVQPVAGFATVAVADDTEVVRSNGTKGTLTDLVPRATVEVTGRPGAPGTLVARRIVLR